YATVYTMAGSWSKESKDISCATSPSAVSYDISYTRRNEYVQTLPPIRIPLRTLGRTARLAQAFRSRRGDAGQGPRHGRRRNDAGGANAGAGRLALDRARPDRGATAPRLRDHQGARGEDRRLVLAEPWHRLSDADLSRGSRLRDGTERGRQETLF